jgi:putative DNA primase/helicase
MDRSARNRRSGRPQPQEEPEPAPAVDLAEWLKSQGQSPKPDQPHAPAAKSNSPALHPALSRSDRRTKAAAYLARIPPAVSGQRGHHQTFRAACVLIQGFDLSLDEARPLLHEWNKTCDPPWSPAELEHKLRDAAKAQGFRARGYLLGHEKESREKESTRQSPQPIPAGNPRAHPKLAAAFQPRSGDCPPGQEANPHRLARLFLDTGFAFLGGFGLRFWRDEFHIWDGSAYNAVPSGEIRAQLTRSIAVEFDRVYHRACSRAALGSAADRGRRTPAGDPGACSARSGSPHRPIPVTSRLVTDVLQALASLVLVPTRSVPAQPAWLPSRPPGLFPAPGDMAEGEAEGIPDWAPEEVLPARNALVHLPSLAVAGATCTWEPTPRFFNGFALDYDFDPHAPAPREWLAFLDQVWGDDKESISCLQEWFGYLLTPDTRQQKMLMMVGPKRSGRGTIARVLKALAGLSTVVNPTLATLARPFGLASLIGKPIAVFPDARLSNRPDNAAIVECLLSISGEDDQTIDRKHLPAWTGKLPTRFVLISNELPRLRDVSGALAARIIILRFTRSFYGQEDIGLFDRLRPELPGILLWSIAGWERLNRRGRFLQPRSASELVATMDELASPIAAFLRDRCVIEPEGICSVASLYEAWRAWCVEHGRTAVGDGHSFGRDLHAAIPGLTTIRPRTPSGRVRQYLGIRLRSPLDTEAETGVDPAPGHTS